MQALHAHSKTPFERIVQELRVERALNRVPFLDAVLNWRNWDSQLQTIELEGLQVATQPLPCQASHFDLTVSFFDAASDL